MSSTLSPALKSFLEETQWNIITTRYACAIGVTILCYDTLLTFGDEVQLLWRSPWNTTKFLLYFNRILAFFALLLNTWHLAGFRSNLDSATCESIIQATAFGAIFSFCIANWMLLLRVSALYGHNRIIFWTLTAFWAASYISTLTMMSVTAVRLHGEITYSEQFHVCLIPRIPPTLPAVWVSPIAFEVITFFMIVYKIWSHAHANGDLKSNPLMRILYRDGLQYFVVIMGIRLFNLVCWSMFPVTLIFVGVFILWALIIVMVERLFLNLRRLHKVKPRVVDWKREGSRNTEREEGRKIHTPYPYCDGAQSIIVLKNDTITREEDYSVSDPTAGHGVIESQASRTERGWNKPLYHQ